MVKILKDLEFNNTKLAKLCFKSNLELNNLSFLLITGKVKNNKANGQQGIEAKSKRNKTYYRNEL